MRSRSWALLLLAPTLLLSSNDAVAATRAHGDTQAKTVVHQQSTPSLSIRMTDTPDPVAVGQQLTYTMTIWNRPPSDDAIGIMLTDTLPTGVELVSAVSSQGACAASGDQVTCALGNLAPGERARVSVVLVPTSEGSIKNRALVMAEDDDVYPPDNSTTEYTTVLAQGAAPLAASAASSAIRRVIDDAVVVRSTSGLSAAGVGLGGATTLREVPSTAGPATVSSESGQLALDAVEGLFRLLHQKDARIDGLEERLAAMEQEVAGEGLMSDLWPLSSSTLPWLIGGGVLGVVMALSIRGRLRRKRSRA